MVCTGVLMKVLIHFIAIQGNLRLIIKLVQELGGQTHQKQA